MTQLNPTMTMTQTPNTPPAGETDDAVKPQGVVIPDEYVTDGKILGRFDNVGQLMDALGQAPPVPADPPQSAPTGDLQVPPTEPNVPSAPGAPLEIPDAPQGTRGLTQEYMLELGQEALQNNGALTDASYQNLKQQGYHREMVDAFIQGQMALRQQQTNIVETKLGGREKIDKALTWAQSNLDKAAQDRINADLSKASIEGQIAIMQGLMSQAGIVGSTVPGTTAPTLTSMPFRSNEEKETAMADPRYATSPEYRAEYENRLRATLAAQTR